MSDTPTPRTDAACIMRGGFDVERSTDEVSVSFARQLERELNAANAELAKYKEVLADPTAVWVNMLRGTIAKPGAITALEKERNKLRDVLMEARRKLRYHAWSDWHEAAHDEARCDVEADKAVGFIDEAMQ